MTVMRIRFFLVVSLFTLHVFVGFGPLFEVDDCGVNVAALYRHQRTIYHQREWAILVRSSQPPLRLLPATVVKIDKVLLGR